MTTNFDAVLAHVAPPGHDPVVGVGNTGKDIGLLDLPADRRGNGIGERSGQRANVAAGLGQQVEEAQFGEHVVVPTGRCSNEAGEAADAIGEAAGLGIDQPSREVVPRCVTGERRIGQANADPVVEPAIEFCQPSVHPFDTIVASRVAIGLGHWLRWFALANRISGLDRF